MFPGAVSLLREGPSAAGVPYQGPKIQKGLIIFLPSALFLTFVVRYSERARTADGVVGVLNQSSQSGSDTEWAPAQMEVAFSMADRIKDVGGE